MDDAADYLKNEYSLSSKHIYGVSELERPGFDSPRASDSSATQD